MKVNAGRWDRLIRILLGTIAVAAGYFALSYLWFLLGVFVTLTGVIGYCPLYEALGIRPHRPHEHRVHEKSIRNIGG